MMRLRTLLSCSLSIVLALSGCTCGPQSSGAPLERGETTTTTPTAPEGEAAAAEGPTFEEAAGGLAWHAEEPLVSRRPSSSMRAAEYVVRDSPESELTVFYFGRDQGGGVDENIDRWVGQFEQPDGRASRDAAQIERIEVQGMPVTTVEVSGAFAGMRGMGGGGEARPGYRMLGAIAEGPEGMVFFKLTGPAEAVDSAETAFRGLVQSLHPTG
ncbi:MAG: hypothetical protein M3Y87_25505 [Myxococcota bacterium]|nr:hypothetical protein [Myxococcota bacterium]